ncbi:unnamed protein product [Polarella glacialis]|uniref:Uncharacterized protein n=1 Tax=Polarella glacialis TaxID=89957 RepID=A0A813INQ2_POLGL|nr:unnamed protein product [Polarella glacialis]
MWRPDPGPCVAQVAEWGEHADDVEYMRQLKALSKKILKRREVTVKDADLAKACQKQGKVHFSVACWNLSEYSRSPSCASLLVGRMHRPIVGHSVDSPQQ